VRPQPAPSSWWTSSAASTAPSPWPATLAKIEPGASVRFLMLPEEKSLLQELFQRAEPLRTQLRRLNRPRELAQARLPFDLNIR